MAAIIADRYSLPGRSGFTAGYYADAVKSLLGQLRHSLGI